MFRGRGELPDFGNNNNDNGNGGFGAPDYHHYWRRPYYIIIRYDKTFLLIELVMTITVLLVAFLIYIYKYETPFVDPIATVKNTFLNSQLLVMGITVIVTGLCTCFFVRTKEGFVRILRIISILCVISVIVHIGVKLHIDSIYNNKDNFAEFYEKYEKPNDKSWTSKTISVKMTGVQFAEKKDVYIEQSTKLYNNFTSKAIIYMAVELFVAIGIFYLSCRISKIEERKNKLKNDDAILFDDEENIKI